MILLCCGCNNASMMNKEETGIRVSTMSENSSKCQILYEEPALNIQVQNVSDDSGTYCILYGEKETDMNVAGDISNIEAQLWGEDVFIVFQFVANAEEQIYIVDTENLAEIQIKNPYEYILQNIIQDVELERIDCFGTDDTGLYFDIPFTKGEDEQQGYIRLTYEFDGVGLNCISANIENTKK